MTQRSRTYLKAKYEGGDIPTATDYADLIDSFLGLTDDADQVPPAPVAGNANKPLCVNAGETAYEINAAPALSTPTITGFNNAAHDHADAAGGGVVAYAAISAYVGTTEAQDATTSGTTGTGDQELKTTTIAAGTAAIGDEVRVKVWGQVSGTADAKAASIKYSASGGSNDTADLIVAAAGDTGAFVMEATLAQTSTSSRFAGIGTLVDTSLVDFPAGGNLNFATDAVTISVRGNPTDAADTVTVNMWSVIVVRGP